MNCEQEKQDFVKISDFFNLYALFEEYYFKVFIVVNELLDPYIIH